MKKYNIKHSGVVKAIAIVVLFVTVFITLAGGLLGIAMWNTGVYKTSQAAMEEKMFEDETYYAGMSAVSIYLTEGDCDSLYYLGTDGNIEVEIVSGLVPYKTAGVEERDHLVAYEQVYSLGDFYDPIYAENISEDAVNDELSSIIHAIEEETKGIEENTEESIEEIVIDEGENEEYSVVITEEMNEISDELWEECYNYEIKVNVYVDKDYPVQDSYYFNGKIVEGIYEIKSIVWPVTGIAFLLAVASFVFLAFSLGWRKDNDKAVVCGTAHMPYDLFGLLILCVITPTFIEGVDMFMYGISYISYVYIVSGVGLLSIAGYFITLFLLDFSIRLKTRTMFSNTLVVKIWKKLELIKHGKQVGEFIFKSMKKLGKYIPMMWLGLVIYMGISLWGLVMVYSWDRSLRFIMWIIVNVVTFPILAYCYYMFCKIKQALRAIGQGNLKYKVNTDLWLLEYKEMGENLNSIGDGMEGAIEEKMKSERMKTELISNVSHDIKTPLTSIVNYADLISKEETGNPKIHEYSEILLRQSDRLKRLTEDLVHASKVTSGNVEVKLAPCNIGVLLNQAIGEYEEKLSEAKLRIVFKQLEEDVVLQADGRHLWRVFDNLLNNICKYAQEGTRVYLTIQEIDHKVQIEFKNISKYELNISEDELMERFVRGDKSRHSEGNGLGLSIAKSLLEVQGGTLNLLIDGDLFKVIVTL